MAAIAPRLSDDAADGWYTPGWLFDELASKYGPFDLDVAASANNAKCERFYTIEDDGRSQPWHGVVWCNPPYKDLIRWVRHAYEEVFITGHARRVVLLLPAQTSTAWFHDYVLRFGHIEWIRGKVRFGGSKDRAIMPSVVVVFEREAV